MRTSQRVTVVEKIVPRGRKRSALFYRFALLFVAKFVTFLYFYLSSFLFLVYDTFARICPISCRVACGFVVCSTPTWRWVRFNITDQKSDGIKKMKMKKKHFYNCNLATLIRDTCSSAWLLEKSTIYTWSH